MGRIIHWESKLSSVTDPWDLTYPAAGLQVVPSHSHTRTAGKSACLSRRKHTQTKVCCSVCLPLAFQGAPPHGSHSQEARINSSNGKVPAFQGLAGTAAWHTRLAATHTPCYPLGNSLKNQISSSSILQNAIFKKRGSERKPFSNM